MNAYADDDNTTLLLEYTPSQITLPYEVPVVYDRVLILMFTGTVPSTTNVMDQFKKALKSRILAKSPQVAVTHVDLIEGESIRWDAVWIPTVTEKNNADFPS